MSSSIAVNTLEEWKKIYIQHIKNTLRTYDIQYLVAPSTKEKIFHSDQIPNSLLRTLLKIYIPLKYPSFFLK